jgi:hypothetical protein
MQSMCLASCKTHGLRRSQKRHLLSDAAPDPRHPCRSQADVQTRCLLLLQCEMIVTAANALQSPSRAALTAPRIVVHSRRGKRLPPVQEPDPVADAKDGDFESDHPR